MDRIAQELEKERKLDKAIESDEFLEDDDLEKDMEQDIQECEKLKDLVTDKILDETDIKQDDELLDRIKLNERLDKEIKEDFRLIKQARKLGLDNQADAIEAELKIKEKNRRDAHQCL